MSSGRGRVFQSAWVALLLVALACGCAMAQASGKKARNKPPKFYAEWLNRDAAYIITKQERTAFLQLTSDDARDNFIQHFWDIRNPNPGSPANAYKDEIYQRIAYADAHFGAGSGEEGWRTDRGRSYITLGPPKQIERYYNAANLRPIEIWFYESVNPALPPFFYVLFYQRDSIGDFRFYSPYMDGPDKLCTGMEAINDPQAALKLISDSAGAEVARISMSLLPGEPLDPEGRVSLQSDILLSKIRDLADQPQNVAELNRRRELVTSVTSQIVVNASDLDILTLPVRNSRGVTRLDYAVRLRRPSDLAMQQTEDGRYSYAIEVRVRVFTPDGKLVFTQEKSVSDFLSGAQLANVHQRPFGYEGILPLPPGKYHLDFLITDWTKKLGLHAERDVTIPEVAADTLVIPGVLAFSSAEPVPAADADSTPFAMAGLKFTPREISPLDINSTQDLQIAYQIWAQPKAPQSYGGQTLDVDFALGRPALPGSPTVLKNTINMSQFSAQGSLVDGKKISLDGDAAGNYVLTISAGPPSVSQKAHASLSLRILGDEPATLPWDTVEPGIAKDQGDGTADDQRGLCLLSQNQLSEARLWFRAALLKNHNDDVARAHLVQEYSALKADNAVVSLFNDAGVTAGTDSGTIALIAESLLHTGATPKAVSLLQDTIHSHPNDGPLYLALADCYQRLGESRQAAQVMRKARTLLGTPATQK